MTRKERALRNLKQMCSDGRYLGSGSHAPLEVLEDFSTAIKALERESKSEWEQDHTILKAYSDGANEVLDKIRAEIVEHAKINQNLNTDRAKALCWCLKVIDKYMTESEDKEKLSWLGKNCKDCGNETCKKLGPLPTGYDCALWQPESEE